MDAHISLEHIVRLELRKKAAIEVERLLQPLGNRVKEICGHVAMSLHNPLGLAPECDAMHGGDGRKLRLDEAYSRLRDAMCDAIVDQRFEHALSGLVQKLIEDRAEA